MDGWTVDPFAGLVINGTLYGRGSIDNKVGVLSILETVDSLLSYGYQPKRTLYFAFGHDEEIGGYNGHQVIASHMTEQGIKLDMLLDEGYTVLPAHALGEDCPNPIAIIAASQKGVMSVNITATGRSGHSAMPDSSSAIGTISAAIAKLQANKVPVSKTFKPPFLRRFDEETIENSSFLDAMRRSTIAFTFIQAGRSFNTLPAACTAIINNRVLPGETVESVLDYMVTTVNDSRVQFELLMAVDPSAVSPTDTFAHSVIERAINSSYRTYVKEIEIESTILVMGTDSRHYDRQSDNIYRFNPIIGELSLFHGYDELKRSHVELSKLCLVNLLMVKGEDFVVSDVLHPRVQSLKYYGRRSNNDPAIPLITSSGLQWYSLTHLYLDQGDAQNINLWLAFMTSRPLEHTPITSLELHYDNKEGDLPFNNSVFSSFLTRYASTLVNLAIDAFTSVSLQVLLKHDLPLLAKLKFNNIYLYPGLFNSISCAIPNLSFIKLEHDDDGYDTSSELIQYIQSTKSLRKVYCKITDDDMPLYLDAIRECSHIKGIKLYTPIDNGNMLSRSLRSLIIGDMDALPISDIPKSLVSLEICALYDTKLIQLAFTLPSYLNLAKLNIVLDLVSQSPKTLDTVFQAISENNSLRKLTVYIYDSHDIINSNSTINNLFQHLSINQSIQLFDLDIGVGVVHPSPNGFHLYHRSDRFRKKYNRKDQNWNSNNKQRYIYKTFPPPPKAKRVVISYIGCLVINGRSFNTYQL
eukprot:gene9736-11371_t